MMKQDNTKINILVAESIELVRIGLRSLFNNHPSFHLVAETACMDGLFDLVKQYKPDVVILDLLLSNDNAAESIARLITTSPNSRVLVFSQNNTERAYLGVLHSGAVGVISKSHSCKMILKAIHAIATGQGWFDRRLKRLEKVSNDIHAMTVNTQINDAFTNVSKLSNCERRVAGLASQGLSAKEIGLRLLISEKTVRNQLSVIYKKMGVKKQVELCLKVHEFKYFQ